MIVTTGRILKNYIKGKPSLRRMDYARAIFGQRPRLPTKVLAMLLVVALPVQSALGRTHGVLLSQRSGLLPGDIIVVSELTPGAVRVFTPTGVLKRVIDHPDWTNSGAGRYGKIGPDGHLWVSDLNRHSGTGDNLSGELYEFDPSGKFLRSFPVVLPLHDPSGVGIRGFTFGPDGTIFIVGGWESGQVNLLLEIEPERGITIRCHSLPFEGVDVGVGRAGKLYVDGYYGGLYEIDRATGSVAASQSCPMSGNNLVHLKTLSSGVVMVCDTASSGPGSVLLFDPSAGNQTPCPTSLPFPSAGPYGIDVWAGKILAGSSGGTLLTLSAATGQVLSSFQVGQQGLPPVISSIVVVP